ncbi:MAG: flagellar motor switch protein FliM [Candidatus Neomarinimicrobiota bacterium]|nr:MAG: flagellar motor switch protein FliM [Candidatus Neomarinimicrobiota bacterium]
MSKILSQEEIDELLSSVISGKVEEPQEIKKKKKISIYDFRRPSFISKEQMRLLEQIHERFVRNLSVFLSAQMRMIVEVKLLGIDQIMYSEFMMSLSSPSAIWVGTFNDPYSKFIVEISPQIVIFIVERLFGGKGALTAPLRPVSVIEQNVMKKIMDRIAKEISEGWRYVKEFECKFVQFERDPEFVQILSASEPVVAVSVELTIRGKSALMNICYPYVWISGVFSRSDVQEKLLFGGKEAEEEEKEKIRENLESARVELRGILGKVNISLRDFVNLRVGDVLRLDRTIEDKIDVFCENKLLFKGYPGKYKLRNAIKITELVKEGNDEA